MRSACCAVSRSDWRAARRDCSACCCFWRSVTTGSAGDSEIFFLVGVVDVSIVFLLPVWEVVRRGEVVEDVGVVCFSFFSSVVLRRDRVSDEPLLSSSPFSFLGVVVALFWTGLRRGDLNGLESVEAAFSARRRFPAKLTEAIL